MSIKARSGKVVVRRSISVLASLIVSGCAGGNPQIAPAENSSSWVELVIQNERTTGPTQIYVQWENRTPRRLGEVHANSTVTFRVPVGGMEVRVLSRSNIPRDPVRRQNLPAHQEARLGDRLLWNLQSSGRIHSVRLPRS